MAFDPDLYERALELAARAHGDQQVPGSGLPYVVHVVKVATELPAAARAGITSISTWRRAARAPSGRPSGRSGAEWGEAQAGLGRLSADGLLA
jgi:hypothetical protein